MTHSPAKARLLAITLALIPTLASANAGTPLIIAGLLHLYIGNFLIGLVEGLLIAFAFRISKFWSMALMIAANYFSAWVGYFITASLRPALGIDLNNFWQPFIILVAAFYLLTILLEWPFIAWLLRKKPRFPLLSLAASIGVQTLTYTLLIVWYWSAIFTDSTVRVVPASEIQLPAHIIVYYIDPDGKTVCSRPLAGGSIQKIPTPPFPDPYSTLAFRESLTHPGQFHLIAESPPLEDVIVLHSAPVSQVPTRGDFFIGDGSPGALLGSKDNLPWNFSTGFWAMQGITAQDKSTREEVRFAIEIPFLLWQCSQATAIPGGLAIFQLGRDQICAFDPATRRVALLWRGASAVPAIEK